MSCDCPPGYDVSRPAEAGNHDLSPSASGAISLVRDQSDTIAEAIDGLVKLELVVFFHQNPETLDNAEGLAMRLGYSSTEIGLAMEELVTGRLMVRHGENERAVYRYTEDAAVRRIVDGEYLSRYLVKSERRRLEMQVASRGRG